MEVKTVNYLLKNYPGLWRQAQDQLEDALTGGSHGDYTQGSRRATGTHSDTTATRAIILAEANDLAQKLGFVRSWINTQLHPGDRHLLLAVWRSNKYGGWWWISKELSKGVAECQERWDNMVNWLAAWLDKT